VQIPNHMRSLLAFGGFCAVAGAWVTLSAEARSRSSADEKMEGSAERADTIENTPAVHQRMPPTMSKRSGGRTGRSVASVASAPNGVRAAAERQRNDAGPAELREERDAAARRELEFLAAQEPSNFLALFDLVKQENRWDAKTIEAARAETHAYILARTRMLEQMLHRHIGAPDADHALEAEALARLDADFKGKLDSLARDIPPLANIQEMLTTTTLKAPSFTAPEEDEGGQGNELQ
jgi:hypothetical protein